AHDRGGVPARKLGPARRQLVEVRRLPLLAAIEPDVEPAQVVGKHDDDIGRPLVGAGQHRSGRENEQRESVAHERSPAWRWGTHSFSQYSTKEASEDR